MNVCPAETQVCRTSRDGQVNWSIIQDARLSALACATAFHGSRSFCGQSRGCSNSVAFALHSAKPYGHLEK
jgi:hypothetical protein